MPTCPAAGGGGAFLRPIMFNNRRLTLAEVCALVQYQGVSADDALTAYYAGRTDLELADTLKECGRTIANWEEYNRPDQVRLNRWRLGLITGEVERRQLVASRGEVAA